MRGLKVVQWPEPVLCLGLGGIVSGFVALRRCRTPSAFTIQEFGRLTQRTVADVRRHCDRVAALATGAEAVIEALGRREDERPIAPRFADGTGAATLRSALGRLDA